MWLERMVGFCCEAIASPTALPLAHHLTHHRGMERHFWIHAVSRRHCNLVQGLCTKDAFIAEAISVCS